MTRNHGESLSYDELDAGRALRANVKALIEKVRAARIRTVRPLAKINATSTGNV
jgi:hypothetical protein